MTTNAPLPEPCHLFNLAALSLCVPPWSLLPPEPAAFPAKELDPEYLQQVDEWVATLGQNEREDAYYDESLPFYLCVQLPSLAAQIPPLALSRAQATSLLLPTLLPTPHLSLSAELSFVEGSNRARRPTLESARRSSLGTNSHTRRASGGLDLRGVSNYEGMGSHNRDVVVEQEGGSDEVPGTPAPVPSLRKLDAVFDESSSSVLVASWNFGEASKWKGQGVETAGGNGRIWVGRKGGEEGKEGWMGVFEFRGSVAFLPSNLMEPKLCLTVTITFRDDPQLVPFLSGPSEGESDPVEDLTMDEDDEYMTESYHEVNLLQSLNNASEYHLPASRLPFQHSASLNSSPPRRKSLSGRRRSVSLSGSVDEPLHPTIRRATRRVLGVHSPLNVRMRTVPCLALGLATSDADENGERDGMVMCIELRGTGDPSGGAELGFEVDSVEVQAVRGSGSGAGEIEIKLIPGEETTLPIRLRPTDQHNLLYSIMYAQDIRHGGNLPSQAGTMQYSGDDFPGAPRASISGDSSNARNVTIVVHGRPILWGSRESVSRSLADSNRSDDASNMTGMDYRSAPFDSRWTCALDVSPFTSGSKSQLATYDTTKRHSTLSTATSVTFPLPFSATEVLIQSAKRRTKPVEQLEAIAGSKRHTMAGLASLAGKLASRTAAARPLSMPNSNSTRDLPPPPPSTAADSLVPSTPGTTGGARRFFSMPSTAPLPPEPSPPVPIPIPTPTVQHPPPNRNSLPLSSDPRDSLPPPPPTPAFPPYSSAQNSFPTLEPLAIGGMASGLKRESWPTNSNALGLAQVDGEGNRAMRGDVLVSVGMIPLHEVGGGATAAGEKWRSTKVRVLDTFLVEVFVLNRGETIKRFTVGIPDQRGGGGGGAGAGAVDRVARIVALESDARIGPLAPQSCQSIRLRFLAMSVGSHTLPELTLLDLETGLETRLKNPVSVVVV